MAEKKPTLELVEIEVQSDTHIHAGEPCPRGTKIKVTSKTAEMLKRSWAKQADKKN